MCLHYRTAVEEMRSEDSDSLNSVTPPECEHTWTFPEAFTTVACFDKYLYAGTVSGQLVTYDLETYQEVNSISAHTGSILTMIVQDGMLFTGSSDSLIKVWKPARKPEFVHLIYMLSDIGDIFSMAYNSTTQVLYVGAQNASLQWVCISEEGVEKLQTTKTHKLPAIRPSKFFDSTGPGGVIAPQQHESRKLACCEESQGTASNLVEVPLDNQVQFAHHSSIYAMVIDDRRSMLVTGSGDGLVKIWHFQADGRPLETHRIEIGLGVLSMSLASSWQLCCGLENEGVAFLDLETFQLIRHEISADVGPLISIAGNNYNVYVASGSDILAYDTGSGRAYRFSAPGVVSAVHVLNRDFGASLLATAGVDGSINLWNVLNYENGLNDPETPETERGGNSSLLKDLQGYSLGNSSQKSRSSAEKLPHVFAKHRQEALGDDAMIGFLRRILKYQTVSNRECVHWSESRRCASAIRKQMRQFGAESELLPVDKGNPIVFARFSASSKSVGSAEAAKNAPTVLFYGHYDVIGARKDNLKWDTPPFQLTSCNGYLYGRGTTDNKGPLVAAMFAVSSLKMAEELSCNVVFLVEGEEESGSFGLISTIEKHRDVIGSVDWILFSNSTWLDDQIPCINYGLRGVIFAEIEVSGKHGDMHSGVAGGMYKEPAVDLIFLLSKLTDPTNGEVLIPGFYESVLPVTEQEKKLYDDITKHTNTSPTELMQRWRYPSLTIHKIDVSGPKNTTVIPNSVTAHVSLRLVPSQTAQEVMEKFEYFVREEFMTLKSQNNLCVRIVSEADPWIGHTDNAIFRVLQQAVKSVWGTQPLFIREGGSIPAARALEKIFDAPAAQLPCGQSSDNAHLNNERIRVENLLNARKVFEHTFRHLR